MTAFPGETGRQIDIASAAVQRIRTSEETSLHAITQTASDGLYRFREQALEQGIDLDRKVTLPDSGLMSPAKKTELRLAGLEGVIMLEAVAPIIEPVAKILPTFRKGWEGHVSEYFIDDMEPENNGGRLVKHTISIGNLPKARGFGIWYTRPILIEKHEDVLFGFRYGPRYTKVDRHETTPFNSQIAKAAIDRNDAGISSALEKMGRFSRRELLDSVENHFR